MLKILATSTALLCVSAGAMAQGLPDVPLPIDCLGPQGFEACLPDLTLDIGAVAIAANGSRSVPVSVTNRGHTRADSVYLDVFFGLAHAPEMGDWSNTYVWTKSLAAGTTITYHFTVQGQNTWVDAIIDTDDYEVEGNEGNNIDSRYVQ